MPRPINHSNIHKSIAAGAKGIKRAGVNTLNTMAFDSLPRLITRAERDLSFKKNARRGLGWRVSKANTAQEPIEAMVFTTRGWLYTHLEKGTRQAQNGWKWRGKNYILVPIHKKAFTAKGRLKAGFKNNVYIVEDGNDALLFYRRRRGQRNNILLASLKQRVDYADDYKPQIVINDVFKEKANRLMNFYLDRELKRQKRF